VIGISRLLLGQNHCGYWPARCCARHSGTADGVGISAHQRLSERKLDAVWLAKVAERQMLRPSFVPPPVIRKLRDMTRYRVCFASAGQLAIPPVTPGQ
jgi:hypothetical protein